MRPSPGQGSARCKQPATMQQARLEVKGRPILCGSQGWLSKRPTAASYATVTPPVAFQPRPKLPWDWNNRMGKEVHEQSDRSPMRGCNLTRPVPFLTAKLSQQGKERSESDMVVSDIDVHTENLVRLDWAELPSARGAQSRKLEHLKIETSQRHCHERQDAVDPGTLHPKHDEQGAHSSTPAPNMKSSRNTDSRGSGLGAASNESRDPQTSAVANLCTTLNGSDSMHLISTREGCLPGNP
ncbi:hypothetical protein ST47_g10144 [Ascochyta rabiei]|uniref:Uncharacterized protein n=1 Tax=Didymella rabiei TaxID=5454 RepID=A0A162W2M8_DIDRA|nr:hypothetical protein ST47_g10144 [Ascochyta rabiei]